MAAERLQKLIARSGLCSRREADAMIRDGRVTVNGQVAVPGDVADPEHDHVKVDGKHLKPAEPFRYILLYKPRQVVTTCDDPEDRATVTDLVRPIVKERVYPVGRLDYHSEGLLLITNDGGLAARIAHPRHGVVREYHVKIRGDLTEGELERLLGGAVIEGRRVRPRGVRRLARTRGGAGTWWSVEVTEGRTHEVRELFFRAGHHVQRLKRTAIGPISDPKLGPGDFRFLTDSELAALRAATRGSAGERGSGPRGRRRPISSTPPASSKDRGRPGRKGRGRTSGSSR
jgi:23S rRNA pseudouridine2605 synthase